ncbi:MAG: hypothetical protein D8M57_13015 [Candidatus Scalindua sp. AMX11]|nr:MAG: hypothetical protein DWQ00_12075 [Candidatus Scalindua sp.]NOG83808.1 hypothetical protein [Planctomycetota bacterium]RZV82963.1 MAG: hypothetical protein EX341_09230 [Candidatus Scalindua sp. SCAELEC01]TDE64415.1 MAG: hypothetical protein D8M57_13015 [Candidatus Scalindua sp. AMX11]GJQ59742.1 MAG: hypothetical protein SCALA701_25430 [Candidatus Scalindua sp.]
MEFLETIEEYEDNGNGEYAWSRCDAPKAIEAIAALGKAFIGGEVLLAVGKKIKEDSPIVKGPSDSFVMSDPHQSGMEESLPMKNGTWRTFTWNIDPRKPSELLWVDYVARTANETLEVVKKFPDEGELDIPEGSELYYCLCWTSENEPPQEG